jgi:hypothetical protein
MIMAASIVLRIRLGPLVSFEIEGDNCDEITRALEGFDKLNQRLDDMCSDLAERVYPEGMEPDEGQKQEVQK